MASRPSFDPGRLSSFEPADIREYYAQLNDAKDDPLLNRAISKTYPPGSTFKVITSAAALAGDTTPETRIPSPRELDLPQTDINLRNFGGGSCTGETSTLAEALEISCNTAFGSLGMTLGDDAIREQAEKFGFGDNDLRVPTRVADSRFPEDANPPQTAQSAIGQFDVRVTPLQMAMVAAGIANGGDVMRPRVVKEVQSPDFSVLEQPEPEVYKNAVSGEVAAELTRMMELVVQGPRGSGKRAAIEGVRVAGKTGTAQHAKGRPPHAWFIGFAPADDPKVAVAVVIEDGGALGAEATGGRLSAPIARDVMRAVLRR
jgi:peptidoglycan glycosyltransferase